MRIKRQTIFEVINSRLTFSDKGCWEFNSDMSGTGSLGYGSVKYQGTNQYVHRVVFKLMKGKVPDSLLVLHNCDNPKCCNPDHLFLGTNKDNTQDMIAKGRHGWRRL